jgi:hypothetical protein
VVRPVTSSGEGKPVATAVAVFNNLGTDNWNLELNESLSLAARLSMLVKSVKTHGHNVKMSYFLWKINSRVGKFFQEVDDVVAGKVVPHPSPDAATPEGVQRTIAKLMELGSSFNGIYEEARRRRLLNNSLIAGPVMALRANADMFFELAEWGELMVHADDVDKIFASAREERAAGNVYDLSQV